MLGLRDSSPILWKITFGNFLSKQLLDKTRISDSQKEDIGIRIGASGTLTDVIASISITAVSFFVLGYTNSSKKYFVLTVILFSVIISIILYGFSPKNMNNPGKIDKYSNWIYLVSVICLVLIESFALYIV